MGKGPFVKKVKGNCLLYLNGYHFKLYFILFPSLQKQSCLSVGKRVELFQIKMTLWVSLWVTSLCLRAQPEECAAVTAVHQPGWVVLWMLLSSVIGRLQQLWPETKLLHLILLIYRILSILFYTGHLCYLNQTFPEQNPFNFHRYQLQLFWPVFHPFFLQRYHF